MILAFRDHLQLSMYYLLKIWQSLSLTRTVDSNIHCSKHRSLLSDFAPAMTTSQIPHPFADPLRLNRKLSPSEEAVIRTSYWETDSSILWLDAQILNLQLRRYTLCNHRQMLATLLLPIRRLPPELLGESTIVSHKTTTRKAPSKLLWLHLMYAGIG